MECATSFYYSLQAAPPSKVALGVWTAAPLGLAVACEQPSSRRAGDEQTIPHDRFGCISQEHPENARRLRASARVEDLQSARPLPAVVAVAHVLAQARSEADAAGFRQMICELLLSYGQG